MARQKDTFYFDGFRRSADYACQAAKLLSEVMHDFNPGQLRERMDSMHAIEKSADEVRHDMMDEVTANGGAVDVNLLESLLGVPVVPISAARNEGIGELVDHALHVARFRERPGRLDFCAPDGPDGGALHRCIHGIANLIEDHAVTAHIPVRFAATKLVEGDELVTEALHLDRNELKTTPRGLMPRCRQSL